MPNTASDYTVSVQNLSAVPVAVIRRTARSSELPKLMPEFCGRVWSVLKSQQARGGRHVAIYWNGDIRLEAGAETESPFADADAVVHSATPAGRAAVVTHFGPYQTLGGAHEAVHHWAETHGERLAGPSWEVYGHWREEWNANPSLIR